MEDVLNLVLVTFSISVIRHRPRQLIKVSIYLGLTVPEGEYMTIKAESLAASYQARHWSSDLELTQVGGR